MNLLLVLVLLGVAKTNLDKLLEKLELMLAD
jgi:hypothetical protein